MTWGNYDTRYAMPLSMWKRALIACPRGYRDPGAGVVRPLPAQDGSDHQPGANLTAIAARGFGQVLRQQPHGVNQQRVRDRVAGARHQPLDGHRQGVQARADDEAARRRRHQRRVEEDRMGTGLGIEQRQPLAVHRVEHRAAGLDGGGRRCRGNDHMWRTWALAA